MRATRREAGFSYVEVLIATVLIALALVPALESLELGIRGSEIHAIELTRHHHLVALLEEVLAQPFSELEAESQAAGGAASAYSDAPGAADRRLVFLSGFDADGDSQPDPGILHVRGEIEATPHVLETLTSP
jgi:type II secretory pathway pseudopilin PulG